MEIHGKVSKGLISYNMKIDFVRHGQTEHNKKGFITGQLDLPLNDAGIEQARNILLAISANYAVLYSSDLLRCRQTADIVNQKLNLPLLCDPRIRGRNFGSLAGLEFSDMENMGDMKEKDRKQEYDYRPFGGESVEDVKKRVLDFVNDLRIKKNGGKVLVITSGGIIRLLHYIVNGKIYDKIDNSSVHEFEFPDNFDIINK